jgi:hypothetical protein
MGPNQERRLTLKELDFWLERNDHPFGMRPIVVIDVPPTSSPSEDLEQLALRNVFAGELFALGNTPAIIGMGFDDPYRCELVEVIGRTFHARASLEETVRELRNKAEELGGPDRYAAAALRSIALHAYEPAMTSIVRDIST